MGRLNYSDAPAAQVPTPVVTDSSSAAASTAFVQALIPAGVVLPYAGPNAPTGWLFCDGQTLNRVDYPALFTSIGTTYGAPDANTFKAPDLRGEFVRGADRGRNVDAGRALGSAQAEDFKSHTHSNNAVSSPVGRTDSLAAGAGIMVGGSGAGPTSGTGGAETRPRNVALHHIIKAI